MQKVSIIIPTYNRAKYLAAAIDSVLAQTCQNWELIVVDDGSTDETATMLEGYGDRLRYIRQRNQGVSAARNHAFRECQGEFVLFLDSDDLLLPNALEALAGALEQNPRVDVVYSDADIIDDSGASISTLSQFRPSPIDDTLESFVVDRPLGLTSTMFRYGALKNIEGPFDELMLEREDHDLLMRMKAAGCCFLYVPVITWGYRFHGGNKSAPKSAWAQERRKSVAHSSQRALDASWFVTLSAAGRRRFFVDLLTVPLEGDYAGQERFLAHPQFGQLPRAERAEVLYELALANSRGPARWLQETRHLVASIRHRPTNPRPYALLTATFLPVPIRRRLLEAWRRLRAKPVADDPVARILREKKVA